MNKKSELIEQGKVAERLFSEGIGSMAICKALNISPSTMSRRTNPDKKDYAEEFALACLRGQEKLINNTVGKLRSIAHGYNYTETTKERNSKGVMVLTKEVTKHHAPNLGAIIFLLTNKDPENWKNTGAGGPNNNGNPGDIARQINADTKDMLKMTIGGITSGTN